MRDHRFGAGWGHLRRDLSYSWRGLRKAPGFTAVAIATIAIGIGAGTAVFSLVNAVLLRSLQVPPDENLPLIETALSSGVCPRFEVKQLPGLNHLFQTSQTGLPDEYGQIRETIAPAALAVISEWILEIL